LHRSGSKIREAHLPLHALYNSGFELLKRFDTSQNRLKIKPVVINYERDYSKKCKNMHVVSMEVLETGEIIDYIYSSKKSKMQLLKEKIERRNTNLQPSKPI
jgi:hypothetical protein